MSENGRPAQGASKDNPLPFDRLHTSVGQFNASGRTMLMPEMAPLCGRLLASCFRAVGVDAVVMDTYRGLSLGKEFTSGKECFPCQVTLGDVLHHLKKEKERLGASFSADRYIYFLPEADGPCRFGMYNKLQRLILDRFEEFKDIPILYVSTRNAYATESIMPPDRSPVFRRLSYVAINIADVMDRTVWRARPYEYRPGIVDELMAKAVEALCSLIEDVGTTLDLSRIYRLVDDIVATASCLIDPHQPRRPRIGIVGEIYLRSHPDSNQNIIRLLERYGGEVVNASLAEWINFIASETSRKLKHDWKRAWREEDHKGLRRLSRQLLGNEIEKLYQSWRQGQVYRVARRSLDIQPDHTIRTLERRLDRDRLFNFDIGTEAALSIGGALEYGLHGFDGVVNVYPFTCMPSTICSAILKPLLHGMRIPYLDTPYDGTIQPNREVALRTFMYQAKQHLESRTAGRNGRTQT